MSDTAETAVVATPEPKDLDNDTFKTVNLERPLKRGDQSVSKIVLRRPDGGELRGVDLISLYRMDVVAVSKIVPRISSPVVASAEFLGMPAPDIAAICNRVSDFLLTKQQKAEAGLDA